jgi:acetyltransferase-like isoleucine patch superfamily enzyme
MEKHEKLAYTLSVLRKNPSELLWLLGVVLTTAKFRYLRRCVGKGTVVGRGTTIINSANVHIAEGCFLQDAIYIRAGTEGNVTLKRGASLNSFCRLFGHGGIEIGEETQVGPGVLITTTTHDYSSELETSWRGVVIGRRCWIGANATILPGVEIGDGTVIGAGSVVTKSIPERSLAVGVPARVVKQI